MMIYIQKRQNFILKKVRPGARQSGTVLAKWKGENVGGWTSLAISLTQGGRSVALVAPALTQQTHRASTLTPLHVLAGLDSKVNLQNFQNLNIFHKIVLNLTKDIFLFF